MPVSRFSYIFLLFTLHQFAQAWYIDSSCDRPKRTYPSCYDESEYLPPMSQLVIDTVRSTFKMSQMARETLRLLSQDKASRPQVDLLDYMFSFAVKDGKPERSDYFERVDYVFEQVSSFNKTRDGFPTPMPSDPSKLPVGDVILFCDYTRYKEGVDCSGKPAPGKACDTVLGFAVDMDSLYHGCAASIGPYGVTYNGEGQSISGIQLCQSSLEHFFWTSPRFWPDAAHDDQINAQLPDSSTQSPIDLVAVYDHKILHEMTHAIEFFMTFDVGESHAYEWRNTERISKESKDPKDLETASFANADNFAYFALGACLITPPKDLKIRPQRLNRDGTMSIIKDLPPA